MQRSNSFVIVEVEMNNITNYSTVIKNIKINQTVLDAIKNYIYYIFSFLYLFLKHYSIAKCRINDGTKTYYAKNIKVILFDYGIFLENFKILIPYENLLYIQKKENNHIFSCLAKFENGKIILGDSILLFEFRSVKPDNLSRLIVNNMNYHLKYNKIDLGIMDYDSVKKFKIKKNN